MAPTPKKLFTFTFIGNCRGYGICTTIAILHHRGFACLSPMMGGSAIGGFQYLRHSISIGMSRSSRDSIHASERCCSGRNACPYCPKTDGCSALWIRVTNRPRMAYVIFCDFPECQKNCAPSQFDRQLPGLLYLHNQCNLTP